MSQERDMVDELPAAVLRIIELALEEDLGRGDVTTRAIVPEALAGRGRAVARQDLVLSGADVFAAVMRQVDPAVRVGQRFADGDRVAAGGVLLEASGPLGSLLMGERVALNFLQRLCGVATLTASFVERLPTGVSTRILDTRKTTPGMRFLEKRAVVHGGGSSHRPDLGSAVLIKENHIAAAGSVTQAIELCRKGAGGELPVQVEVQSLSELEQALAAGADAVLLDNMQPDDVRACVAAVGGRAFVEVSGGVGLENVGDYALAGVDAISVGALTHSAPAADISFLVDAPNGGNG
jgi:nicotinate-nucleotide pyrophosphorylase (carboxylating)